MSLYRKLVLLLCFAFSTSALADLKVYEVDAKYRQEVFTALRGVLNHVRDGVPTGAVELLPTGQILVDTTPEMHQQVAAVLEAISEYEAEPAPRVTLQYWVVIGTSEATGGRDTPAVLAEVLNEIRQVHGPLSFSVLGNATLVTESGRHGQNNGELSITQLAYVQDATLNADLMISFEYPVVTGQFLGGPGQQGNSQVQVQPFQTIQRERQGIDLDTSMTRDEFVVVGENTIRDIVVGPEAVDGTVFYIVHWPAGE